MHKTAIFAAKAFPNQTTRDRNVQLGVLVEEFTELLSSITCLKASQDIHHYEPLEALRSALVFSLKRFADRLKTAGDEHIVVADSVNMLDALCDIRVMTYSVSQAWNFKFEAAVDEVDRSNFSKFVDNEPIFNEYGKLAKGPNYTRPDLTPFI